MGLLDRISYTMETVKKQKDEQELKRALALKELRDGVIPMFQRLIDKYHARVKYLDMDAMYMLWKMEKSAEHIFLIPQMKFIWISNLIPLFTTTQVLVSIRSARNWNKVLIILTIIKRKVDFGKGILILRVLIRV